MQARSLYSIRQLQEQWQAGYQQGVSDMTPDFVLTGPLAIDVNTGRAYIDGVFIYLSRNETKMLVRLARSLGKYVSEEELVPELLTSEEILVLDRKHRIDSVQGAVKRLRQRLRPHGLQDIVISKYSVEISRMLVQLPSRGWDEEGDTAKEQNVGYSRTEVRSMLVKALAALENEEQGRSQALLRAAISGLPTPQESAALSVGRPNIDRRVLDALIELGADEKYITLPILARYLKLTQQVVSKALARTRQRHPEIGHVARKGYYLDTKVAHSGIPSHDFRATHAPDFIYVKEERASPGSDERKKFRREYMRRYRDAKNPNRRRIVSKYLREESQHEDEEN
jgi:Response regulators consisting of a CheY-like receiver domain and a winged-helix DNA-binding domain